MATSKQPSPVFKEPMPYTREVILFRLGGVALYQSTVNAIAMISLGVISSRSESPRSFLTIVACSLFLLVLHILPSTVLSLAQVKIPRRLQFVGNSFAPGMRACTDARIVSSKPIATGTLHLITKLIFLLFKSEILRIWCCRCSVPTRPECMFPTQ